MTSTIRLYRKAKTPKVSKTAAEAIRRTEAITCRVHRPSLLDFLLDPAGFASLPEVPPQVIDNRAERILNHHAAGWTLPADSLGRKGQVDASTAQSVLLWIKKNVPAVDPAAVSVVVEPDHDATSKAKCSTCGTR